MSDTERKLDNSLLSDYKDALIQIRVLAERLDAAIEISKALRVDVATLYRDMINMKVKVALTAGTFGGMVGFAASMIGKLFVGGI